MRCILILLTLAYICHIISAQHDDDPFSGLGHLRTRMEERVFECGKSWLEGCLTRVTARPNGSCQCDPYLEISSGLEENGHLGGSITLFCLFSGFPLPTITWNGPQNHLPSGRYRLSTLTTIFTLNDITASDEGNYTCSAANVYGQSTHTLQIRVVAAPEFKIKSDGPRNISVTEGESATFNCNPFAKPEANIVWLQNEQPIDTNNPPERFVFSNDNRTLTIRNVCRDCVDRESKTDLMAIQCNASNVHGHIFASGYLNVLTQTNATIRGLKNVSVDFLKDERFVFQCVATSDPSHTSTVRWYKTEPYNELVHDEPPYVYVTKDILVIMFHHNCFVPTDCLKYLGEYRCVVDVGISRGSDTITLTYHEPVPEEVEKKVEPFEVCKIILTVGAVVLILILIGVFLLFHSRWHLGFQRPIISVNRRTKGRELPNPHSLGQSIEHKPVNLPLLTVESNDTLMRNACSMCEHPGYESIDQVLEDMSRKKSHSAEVHGYNRYETTCAPQKEGVCTGTPMMNEETTMCDDAGNSTTLKEVNDGGQIDQQRINGRKSVLDKWGKIPKSNDPSESMDDNSNLNLDRTDGNFDLGNSGLKPRATTNPYLDLFPEEVNQYMDMESKKENESMDMVPMKWNQCLDKGPKESNQYMNMGPKEENQYMDQNP